MASGDAHGYNPNEVEALAPVIDQTAQNCAAGVVEILHDQFVVPMSDAWFAQDAVDFFDSFNEIVKSTGTSIQEAFDAFRTDIQDLGNAWAELTKGPQVNLSAVSTITLNLSYSEIKTSEPGTGNVIIYESKADSVADSLADVRTAIEDKMKEAAEKLDASASFFGGNQAQAIEDCFTRLSAAVAKVFDFLCEGENNFSSQIHQVASVYGDQSSEAANSYNNATFE